jgi:transketolase C-terminal domain/subunit
MAIEQLAPDDAAGCAALVRRETIRLRDREEPPLRGLGVLRSIVGMTVICPCDKPTTRAALRQTVDVPGPVCFRLGRGREPAIYSARLAEDGRAFEVGRIATPGEGGELTIVSNGITVPAALAAAEPPATEDGVEATVLDPQTVRPLDNETFCRAAEHSSIGPRPISTSTTGSMPTASSKQPERC